jgi:hypothetical protein
MNALNIRLQVDQCPYKYMICAATVNVSTNEWCALSSQSVASTSLDRCESQHILSRCLVLLQEG